MNNLKNQLKNNNRKNQTKGGNNKRTKMTQLQQQQHESRFLEALFVRMLAHAISELKNSS